MSDYKIGMARCASCGTETWVRTTDNLCVKCAKPEATAKRWERMAKYMDLEKMFVGVKR
jgi:hypothetical protein